MKLSATIPQSDDEGWPHAPEVLGNRFLRQSQIFKDSIWIFATPSTALQARNLNQSAWLGCLLCAALPRFADDFYACPHAGKVKPGCECYSIWKRCGDRKRGREVEAAALGCGRILPGQLSAPSQFCQSHHILAGSAVHCCCGKFSLGCLNHQHNLN